MHLGVTLGEAVPSFVGADVVDEERSILAHDQAEHAVAAGQTADPCPFVGREAARNELFDKSEWPNYPERRVLCIDKLTHAIDDQLQHALHRLDRRNSAD